MKSVQNSWTERGLHSKCQTFTQQDLLLKIKILNLLTLSIKMNFCKINFPNTIKPLGIKVTLLMQNFLHWEDVLQEVLDLVKKNLIENQDLDLHIDLLI